MSTQGHETIASDASDNNQGTEPTPAPRSVGARTPIQVENDMFIDQWIADYTTGQERDESLWDIFKESFEDWTTATFRLCQTKKVQALRSALRNNGVWVKRGPNAALRLYEVINSDTQANWPEEDVEMEVRKHMNSWRNYEIYPRHSPHRFSALIEPRQFGASIDNTRNEETGSPTGKMRGISFMTAEAPDPTNTVAPQERLVARAEPALGASSALRSAAASRSTEETAAEGNESQGAAFETSLKPSDVWMSGGNPAAPPENPARNTSTLPPPHWSNQHNSNWKREVNTQRNNTYNAENTQPPGDFPGFSAYSKAPRLRQQTPWQYKQSLPVHQEDSLRPKEPPSANPTLGNGRLSQEWQSPQVSSDVSRNLLQLIKIYDKDLRYRGSEDSLDQCLVAFYDFCQVAMVEPNYHHRAFPTMLAGEAKTFYFDYVANQNYDFGTMVQLVRANFETEERARKIQLEWDTMTFGKIRQSNAGKNYSLIESFDQLAKKLRKLQLGLRQEKRTDAELKDKLLQAMFGVPECDLAVYSGAASFHTACEAIRRSLAVRSERTESRAYAIEPYTNDETHYCCRNSTTQAEQLYADRKLNYSRSGKRENDSKRALRDRKCWICRKTGCFSTNHSKEEKDASYEKWKASKRDGKATQTSFRVFLIDQEGMDPNEDYNFILDEIKLSDESESEVEHQITGTFTVSGTHYNGKSLITKLTENSAYHAISRTPLYSVTKEMQVDHFMSRYSTAQFMGFMLDSGAANKSSAGAQQFEALKRVQKVSLDTSRAGEVVFKFGIGKTSSIGVATVETPLGKVEFHIVKADVPFLLSLADLDRLVGHFDNLRNVVVQGSKQTLVVRRFGHPWVLLDQIEPLIANSGEEILSCHLTESELRTIHRRFGHPTVRRLELLLERAGHDVDSDALLAITKVCEHCQKHGGPPGRFKFTLKDDVSFNHTIIIDIVDLRGRKAIQVVDEATSFNSARFVKSMSAVHAWEALRACWIDVYQGPPDFIVHDPGTNFHSKEFRDYAKSMGSATRTMPIESHNSIGKVERYHIPLRRAYNIMCDEMANLSDAERLQMAVKAVNDTAGPNGLIPTLLVFGAYPRIAENSAPSPTVTERAGAIKKAMNEVRKCHALRQVTEALRTRNGPRTTPIHDLPLNSEVMVWREHKGWEGPFTLLGMDGESCLIGFPNAPPRAFRSTKIKPFLRASDDLQILKEDLPGDGKSTSLTGPAANTRSRTVANREEELEILMTTTEDNQEAFEAWLTEKEIRDAQISIDLREKGIIKTPGKSFELSRRTEIDGLLARGVFKMINENDPSIGKERIFGSRLVDEVKGKETPVPYEKSRLVIQAYNDKGKKDILTQSPTIQRVSQRILVALAATLIEQGLKLCLRDITQAYVQSLTKLRRKVYARPPKEMVDELPKGTIFEVILPLYGIPEAGNHWFNTYYKHHLHNLIMETSTYDPCLLITKESEPALGIVGMQTDDTLILGEPDFLAKEDVELKAAKLLAKDTETLSTRNSLMFNGCIITQEKHSLAIAQKGQGKRIEAINTKSSDFRQAFMEQRARGAYIAAICQPEATYDTAVAAQQHEPLLEDVKLLNKRLLWQKGKLSRGIRYVPLDLSTAKLYVFVDASFANNKDLSSQIGYVIVLGNEAAGKGEFQLTGNIIHWSSTKCKRVTRAVLASELYAMAAGVDIAISISTTLAMIAHRLKLSNIPTILCTDSFSLYECIVKLGTTKEKRLMIDIMAIRQSYERRELSEVRWVEGNSNPADAMTKANPNKALEQLIDNNQLTVKIDGWIERPQQEA